jgi:hypothetical protein
MRSLALVAAILCCACGDDSTFDGDAGVDGPSIPTSGTYWPCHAWTETSSTLTKCAPKCANRTLLGRFVWGVGNTCEYQPGQMCPTEFMTGPAYEGGTGCCVYSETPTERVEFVGCL